MSFRTTLIVVWERLLYNRWPLIGGFLRRAAAAMLIEDGSPEAMRTLAKALNCMSIARDVRDMLWGNIDRLIDPIRTRGPLGFRRSGGMTDWALLPERQDWVRLPLMENQARAALKAGDLDTLKACGPEWVEPLLAACDAPDYEVRGNLAEVLRYLEKPESREALCRCLIERDYPLARAVVIEMSLAPQDPAARALFFLLTGQSVRLFDLDHDWRLVSAAYAAETADVRRRTREILRITGHSELLTRIINEDSAAHVVEIPSDAMESMVEALYSRQDWPRLWQLVSTTMLPWSAHILRILSDAGWRPPEADRALFVGLRRLLEGGLMLDPGALSQEFPRALLQAQLHAPARINAVAFAPDRPWLGVGTEARKVFLWNYQTAQKELVLEGFAGPVGHLAFTGDGMLACAERFKLAQTSSGVYVWNGQALRKLGQHHGWVTALEAVSGSMVLSAGRDCDLVLWDLATGQQLARHTLSDWPRAVWVAPSGDAALVALQRETQYLNLADMSVVMRLGAQPTMPTCAAFFRQKELVFIGRGDGAVAAYSPQLPRLQKERDLRPHALSVEGIAVLLNRRYILTAGREGKVHFLDLFNLEQIDSAPFSTKELTSFRVSPDEAFMAIGHVDNTFSLWDLRGPDVAALVRMPLASVSPLSLGALDAFANNLKLREPVRRALAYIALIVRHRIRFDIELEPEAPSIKAGEFDIELN